jgi:hypothetical protein
MQLFRLAADANMTPRAYVLFALKDRGLCRERRPFARPVQGAVKVGSRAYVEQFPVMNSSPETSSEKSLIREGTRRQIIGEPTGA